MPKTIRQVVLAFALSLCAAGAIFGAFGRGSPAGAQQLAVPLQAQSAASANAANIAVTDLASVCQPAAMQAVASRLSIKVTVQELPRNELPGPFLPGGVRYTPAAGRLPAYCQVTGSFVTNSFYLSN